MIKRLIVKNLNGRFDFDLTFHRDLNILVGQNGCGKTSLLKLMWYVYSGNIYFFLADVVFESVELESFAGDTIKLRREKSGKIYITSNGRELGDFAGLPDRRTENGTEIPDSINDIVNDFARDNDSIFMPTFRRIEGGFGTIGANNMLINDLNKFSNHFTTYHKNTDSGRYVHHRFVASLSTQDIINTVTAKYSDISQELRKLEERQSEFILKNTSNGKGTETALKDIQTAVEANDKKRKEILNPMIVLSNLVKKIIKNKEIQLTKKLSLGEGEKIKPDKLSFGEKQMLSFLCYNFFADDTIIFIDEPEMSLHVDWQRILFPVLMEQNTTNQFIVATHSPFIYAQYQDKQIELKQQELVTV